MKYINYIKILSLIILLGSCKKYLDKKSNPLLDTPKNLDDLQLILNEPNFYMAMTGVNVASDEYYLRYNDWLALTNGTYNKEAYIWDARPENTASDWSIGYNAIFYANTVLDHLENMKNLGSESEWNDIKGQALFYRAHSFFQLSQMFSTQFNSNTADNDLGISLRLTSDFNKPTTRATVKQSHERIITDLEEALPLLPQKSQFQTRPGRATVYALLARTYLIMEEYTKAREAADNCLKLYDTLMHYKDISTIVRFNPEVIFYTMSTAPINGRTYARVDSSLYKLFDSNNDLRKTIFFKDNGDKTYLFRGSYDGASTRIFNGIATDEVYLIRAEAYAHEGNIINAMADLNKLLTKRWKPGTFTPLTANSMAEALSHILRERRKELIYRGTRWSDIRRLNNNGANISIERNLNGQNVSLSPNDPRFLFLIPQDVIDISGIQQNPR
jgi:starch-binding outer membrane protein, SusD/RagB family